MTLTMSLLLSSPSSVTERSQETHGEREMILEKLDKEEAKIIAKASKLKGHPGYILLILLLFSVLIVMIQIVENAGKQV